MLLFFWAFLNFLLFVYVIIMCFKASRFIKGKVGWLPAFIFVLGVVSLAGFRNVTTDTKDTQRKKWDLYPKDSIAPNTNQFIITEVETNWMHTYNLGIHYGQHKNLLHPIPVNASAWATGFSSGTTWNPVAITVNKTESDTLFEYEIQGTVQWNLLGLPLYAQTKIWKGIAKLSK